MLGINTALREQGNSGDDQPIEEIVVEGSRLEAIRAEPHLATDQQLRWAMDQIWDNAWESLNAAGAAVGLDASIEGFKDLKKLKGKRALVLAMALGIPIGGYWLAIAVPIIAEMNRRGID